VDRDALEAQLAHSKDDKVVAAYDRNTYLERRTELCAEWAQMILRDAPDAYVLLFGTMPENLTVRSTFFEAAE
jgi:hypothetical protein